MTPDYWTSNDESAWRRKIGMPKKDDSRPPKKRNVCLRRLKGLVEQRMLHFIYDSDKDPVARKERTSTWTPIPWICHNLEISHAHLSRLFRELLGLNVIQFYDRLKLEETLVVLKYIALVQKFLASLLPAPAESVLETRYTGNGSKHFWQWLKQTRQNPDFDRQALAREFNFPSAARFHCAFNSATNLTPREFENLILRQALDDPKELERTIASYTPAAEALQFRSMYPMRNVQEIFPDPEPEPIEAAAQPEKEQPIELEYPIELHADSIMRQRSDNVIAAIFTFLKRFAKRPKQQRALPPPQDEPPLDPKP